MAAASATFTSLLFYYSRIFALYKPGSRYVLYKGTGRKAYRILLKSASVYTPCFFYGAFVILYMHVALFLFLLLLLVI